MGLCWIRFGGVPAVVSNILSLLCCRVWGDFREKGGGVQISGSRALGSGLEKDWELWNCQASMRVYTGILHGCFHPPNTVSHQLHGV